MLGWFVVAQASALDVQIHKPCATLERLPHAPALVRRTQDAARLVGGPLTSRDPYGVPNVAFSQHFALRWGNLGGISPNEVDRLLAAFEQAWQVQIDTLGMRAPGVTADEYFNVYLGDTGNNAPNGYGAGGYYWVDIDGFPMVVVAAASLGDPAFGDHTAYHEFFHALQGETGRYEYEGYSAWYWEATAEWAAIETNPEGIHNGSFVFSYLLLPSLSLNFFDYPDTGALQEYFQYGAFLFPHDVTQQLGVHLVPDTWRDRSAQSDPLEVLRGAIDGAGGDLDTLWLDHLAHNVVLDYDAGETYGFLVDAYEPYFAESHRLVDSVQGDGGSGRVGGQTAPRRYGSATIALYDPEPGTLEVRIVGETEGTMGTRVTYGARATVIAPDGSFTYHEVAFDGVQGQLDLPEIGAASWVALSVGAIANRWDEDRWLVERFPFDWSLEVVAVEVTTPTEPSETPTETTPDRVGLEPPIACGCSQTSTFSGLWLGLGLLVARRRQQPAKAKRTSLSSS